MKKELEVSLREARKANEVLDDNSSLMAMLEQTSSNTWVLPEWNEDDEDEVEYYEQLMCDINETLRGCGISTDEYWFNEINEED